MQLTQDGRLPIDAVEKPLRAKGYILIGFGAAGTGFKTEEVNEQAVISHTFVKPAQGQAMLSIRIEALPVGIFSMQTLPCL